MFASSKEKTKQNNKIKKKGKNKMKIVGLKVLTDKGWKADSTFTTDQGQTMQVPANHKFVMFDENKDVVNATIITPQPLNLPEGKMVDLTIVGTVSKSQFGWSFKATLAK